MAIDTRDKRQSAAWVGFPGAVSVFPAGSIGAAAREQIAWTYRGIAADAPAAVTAPWMSLLGVGI